MKSKRHEKSDKIFQLFQGALEVDQDKRAAFLDRECGGDEEMRREVEALLVYDKRAERFIESPAIEEASELIADSESSSTVTMAAVGPFKLVKSWDRAGWAKFPCSGFEARTQRRAQTARPKFGWRQRISLAFP